MKCPRCNGLMYQMELRDNKGYERLKAMVCVLCGEIVDPVIADNRKKGIVLEEVLPRKKPRRRIRSLRGGKRNCGQIAACG